MIAIAKLVSPAGKSVVFDIDAIASFSDSGTNTSPKVKIMLKGASAALEIAFSFQSFMDTYLKYKRGGMSVTDFAQDANSMPINGLVKLHT